MYSSTNTTDRDWKEIDDHDDWDDDDFLPNINQNQTTCKSLPTISNMVDTLPSNNFNNDNRLPEEPKEEFDYSNDGDDAGSYKSYNSSDGSDFSNDDIEKWRDKTKQMNKEQKEMDELLTDQHSKYSHIGSGEARPIESEPKSDHPSRKAVDLKHVNTIKLAKYYPEDCKKVEGGHLPQEAHSFLITSTKTNRTLAVAMSKGGFEGGVSTNKALADGVPWASDSLKGMFGYLRIFRGDCPKDGWDVYGVVLVTRIVKKENCKEEIVGGVTSDGIRVVNDEELKKLQKDGE